MQNGGGANARGRRRRSAAASVRARTINAVSATASAAARIFLPLRGKTARTTAGTSVSAHTMPGVLTVTHATTSTHARTALATVRSPVQFHTAMAASA